MSKNNQPNLRETKEKTMRYNLNEDIDLINSTYNRQRTSIEASKIQPMK